MTDHALAAELEFYKGNEDLISPDLISKASERIYALSANCSLLKASLAHAERESEAALSALTANAEPFGYFRCLPLSGWEDCAETDEGAIPLYERPQTDRVAKLEAEVERLRALLSEAADEIQNWGAYASEYFQEKHDLAGCVAEFKAAAMAGKEAKS